MSTDESKRLKRAPRKDILQKRMASAHELVWSTASLLASPEKCEQEGGAPCADDSTSATTKQQLDAALKTIAAVATAVWRARTKLETEADAELPEGLRNLPRHIQSAWDALEAGRIHIDSPTGQRYVPGMAVNTLTFQPLDGITYEVIHETLKPSVYFNDTLIQRADVIIGRPAGERAPDAFSDGGEHDTGNQETHKQKGINADGTNNN